MRMGNPGDYDIASELDGNYPYGRGSLTAPKVGICDSDFHYLCLCLYVTSLHRLIFVSWYFGYFIVCIHDRLFPSSDRHLFTSLRILLLLLITRLILITYLFILWFTTFLILHLITFVKTLSSLCRIGFFPTTIPLLIWLYLPPFRIIGNRFYFFYRRVLQTSIG